MRKRIISLEDLIVPIGKDPSPRETQTTDRGSVEMTVRGKRGWKETANAGEQRKITHKKGSRYVKTC